MLSWPNNLRSPTKILTISNRADKILHDVTLPENLGGWGGVMSTVSLCLVSVDSS